MSSYLVTSDKMSGRITLMYDKSGYLTAIKLDLKRPLTEQQFAYLITVIPYTESELKENGLGLLQFELDRSNLKIASFCKAYEAAHGIKYKVTAAESGKIKGVDVNDELLKVYFSSDNFLFKGKHSISNFVKYYNELRLEAAKGPVKKKGGFPDHYDRDYEGRLSGLQLQEYRKHLRNIGLKPVYHGQHTSQIIDWK